jgi:hypothetical protein
MHTSAQTFDHQLAIFLAPKYLGTIIDLQHSAAQLQLPQQPTSTSISTSTSTSALFLLADRCRHGFRCVCFPFNTESVGRGYK